MPTSDAAFLTKPGHVPKVFNGVEGEKLRSIKLRGTVSQGLILPLSVLAVKTESGNYLGDWGQFEGHDVTERLGIQKYEKPLSAELQGVARGNYPSRIPKTDEERIQNLARELNSMFREHRWEKTEKLEGSSMTVYTMDGEFGVCSRNLDLERNEDNTFWKVAIREKLEEKLMPLGIDIALQGELIGPGVEGNIYGLTEHQFRVYKIVDINNCSYYPPLLRRQFCQNLSIDHVPVDYIDYELTEDMPTLIAMADSQSHLAKVAREGDVYKSLDGKHSFKIVSNSYLLHSKQ
jgi:RNA ligase (TIGR02306 family)